MKTTRIHGKAVNQDLENLMPHILYMILTLITLIPNILRDMFSIKHLSEAAAIATMFMMLRQDVRLNGHRQVMVILHQKHGLIMISRPLKEVNADVLVVQPAYVFLHVVPQRQVHGRGRRAAGIERLRHERR